MPDTSPSRSAGREMDAEPRAFGPDERFRCVRCGVAVSGDEARRHYEETGHGRFDPPLDSPEALLREIAANTAPGARRVWNPTTLIERVHALASASTEPIGYYVWTDVGGYAFKNRLHRSREAAEAALASVVWHNRHNYAVRAVYLAAVEASNGT